MNGLLHHFDSLMDHLGSREDSLAEEFRELLEEYVDEADANQHWVDTLDAAGVDNWEGYEYAQELMGVSND